MVTYQAIAAALWQQTPTDIVLQTQKVANHLKTALDDLFQPTRFVEHIEGQGFVFVGEVEFRDNPQQQPVVQNNFPERFTGAVTILTADPALTKPAVQPRKPNTQNALFALPIGQLFVAGLLCGSVVEIFGEFAPSFFQAAKSVIPLFLSGVAFFLSAVAFKIGCGLSTSYRPARRE